MSIADLFHWVQETAWATALRESALVYPIVMSLHLSALAFFGGTILITNLRLLGLALREVPVRELVNQLRPWKWAGFAVMVTCGFLLAASKADGYYPNPYFRLKMSFIALVGVHSLIFRQVYRQQDGRSVGYSRMCACLSLGLWLAVISMGRWIAYYEPPRG